MAPNCINFNQVSNQVVHYNKYFCMYVYALRIRIVPMYYGIWNEIMKSVNI
jgi:hypothetical protein